MSDEESGSDDDEHVMIRSYKYRWIILALFGSLLIGNGATIGSLFIISDSVCKFYGIKRSALLAAQNAGSAVSILVLIPATFIPSKYGLRTTVVFGAGFTALGTCFLIGASQHNGYYYFVVCQILLGIANGLLTQLSPEISAVWFPTRQHALATCLCMQMLAIGYGICDLQTIFIFNHVKQMGATMFQSRLNIYIFSQSGFCVVVFILVLLFFRDLPKLPPSLSQAKRAGPGMLCFSDVNCSLKKLIKSWKFIGFANVFALNYAIGVVYPLILNTLVTSKYDNGDELVGLVGIGTVVACSVSSILFAIILDKIKHYKLQLLLQLGISVTLWVSFTIAFKHTLTFYAVSILVVVFWFIYFSTTSLLVETIAEITYPITSSIAIVICLLLGNLYGILLNYTCGWFIDHHKVILICWLFAGELGLQFVLLLGLKVKKKRSFFDGTEPNPTVKGT